jgi:23S rRNA (cytidine1920-2'-O)/16S rRNA (cytidine1409-2'-O)-methyltransferase
MSQSGKANSEAGGPVFVSRGGQKLRHALDAFRVDPTGLWCADLGCSTGGFTDCLLQAGAERVFSVDTGYGVIAYKLRTDKRVTVIERSNALHVAVHAEAAAHGGVDLVVMDLGWTPQRLAVPAAAKWMKPGGRMISLVKPHYEVAGDEKQLLVKGVLSDEDARRISRRTIDRMGELGMTVLGEVESPVRGSAGKKEGAGNLETLVLLAKQEDHVG